MAHDPPPGFEGAPAGHELTPRDRARNQRQPVSYVSYGGPGVGTRAVEQLRGVAVELQQAPLRSQVIIHRPWPHLKDGVFDGSQHERQAGSLLDELVWWSEVLRAGRAKS